MTNVISNSDKKNILTSLNDEVRKFHPLLEKLLPSIPRVKVVHYTHGQNEKGADFIVIREDDVLLEEEYIGVIAKIGKIHQDLSKIREQIEECELGRYSFNGKKKIRLDEIWIITNEHITDGAKEKIYQSYSTKKIKFFQNTNLIKLIDKNHSSFWFDIPVDIGDYLSRASSQIRGLDNSVSLLSFQDKSFYIDHDIIELSWDFNFEDQKRRKKIKAKDLYELIIEKKIVYIEGRAGFGKSKLLRYTIEKLCSPLNYQKYKFVPIYLTYRDFVEDYNLKCDKVIESLLTDSVKQKIRSDIKLVFFFDAFDEKSYGVTEEFDKFSELIEVAKRNPEVHFVVTSRPLNYAEPQKMKELGIASYELAPLSLSKIILFFEEICKQIQISGRIIQDIKKSQLFRQLPRSPISAILLANLLNNQTKELPSNLTELYSKYSELMLGRWDISKGLQSEKEYEAAQSIIKLISIYCIDNDLEYLAIDEAKNFFDNYLKDRNLDINATELFEKVTTRSGILQKEPSYNRVFFKHRTFAEFFYAYHKKDHYDKDFISSRIYESYWRNIYFFYLGLKKDCETTLSKMLAIEPSSTSERFSRFINMGDYFLASYATRYKFISNSFREVILEMTTLYFDITQKKIDSSIQQLSEISILYLFQFLIRNLYAFEFFYKAIEDSVIENLSSPELSNKEKIYSSFFLSTICIDLEKENPFDGLLDNYVKVHHIPQVQGQVIPHLFYRLALM